MLSPVALVASGLYAKHPASILYHYTSLEAVLKIAPSASLWATDIHYLNDSSELTHAVDSLVREAHTLRTAGAYDDQVLSQLIDWLNGRLADGHMLFVTCFSENGNLLSQWRGYTPHGKGISLGFAPEHLLSCASKQEFALGQCIYELDAQRKVASATIRAVAESALAHGPSAAAHPSQSFHPAFAAVEPDLLRIAALLKNDAFQAELEWRAVSPTVANYVDAEIHYRAGRTTLVPYLFFKLAGGGTDPMPLEQVYLGPTPQNNLAMGALAQFLARNRAGPRRGVRASGIPYRET